MERGVPLTLKTMALAWNHHEIEAMEAYARGLGLVFRFDSSLNPRVDCGANRNSELQLDPERALELDLGSPERMEGFREFCERFTRPDKVEKWFRRNCNDVLGRACTASEKGDVLAYLMSLGK